MQKSVSQKTRQISKWGIFLGTSEKSKAYLIGIESDGKLKAQKSRNVIFDEFKLYFEKKIESDEGEIVGNVVFVEEVLKKIPKGAKEALADPD